MILLYSLCGSRCLSVIFIVLSSEGKSFTQGKAQQLLGLLYSHFQGSSSTRQNPAVLPFLPMVTWKQLSTVSN